MTLSLRKINISQFRCYDALRLDLMDTKQRAAGMIVLTGPNGAGKTNILEAVSLLVPGKGLRSADMLEMKRREAKPEDVWAVSAEIETASGLTVRIGTGLLQEQDKKRRLVRINGKDAKSQSDLSGFIAAVWLTPQMDRLFLEGSSARRRFLDRLVFAYDPDHITRLNRYEKTLRERMKLLQLGRPADPQWLTALETQAAADGVSIAAARVAVLEKLQQHVGTLSAAAPLFPQPHLSMTGWVEDTVTQHPAVDVEDILKGKMRTERGLDAQTGRTQHGIHRSDLRTLYADKNIPAAQCSTGEQKALLVSIILAHALMMQAEKGYVPLILLDEVAAHLDSARRAQLFTQLSALKGQIWLTGTEEDIFNPLGSNAKFFCLDNGHVVQNVGLRVAAS